MNKSEANVFLDCKGIKLPIPVVKIKKALDSLESGQVLLVEVRQIEAKGRYPGNA